MSRRRPGFTLAETTVAIGVLAVVVLFLIGLVATNLSLQDKGEENIAAAHVAELEMNQLKSRPYGEIAALVGTPAAPTTRGSDGREYTCRTTVAPLQPAPLNPNNTVLEVTLHLEWTESTVVGDGGVKGQRQDSMELRSVVTPGGAL